MPDPKQEKAALRREIRAHRQALPAKARDAAARRVADQLSQLPQWTGAVRLALYLPQNGEIDTMPIAELARRQGKQLYLPVLAPDRHLDFARWQEGAALSENRYGIPEPGAEAPRSSASELDLILLPLVAWSLKGDRLGMGGGYYDRSLANVQSLKIGLAYELQRRDSLPREAWDIRLDFVATETAVYDFRGSGEA